LFDRAIRKFRSDLGLHLQHAEWCKQQKSWTRLGRVYAEALQIFPRQAGLWIEAASHEFFGPNRSIRNARVLLQRGIRLNKHSEELWVEYFSLELHYAQTLKGRRQILLQPSQDDPTTAGNDEAASAKEEYKLAEIILRNAIGAIPGSVKFRLRFMDTCKRFPSTNFLMEYIQESMKRDFASEPESWIARALFEAERCRNGPSNVDGNEGSGDKQANGEGSEEEENSSPATERPSKKARTAKADDPVVAVLQEAILSLPTEEMFIQAFRFAQDYLNELDYDGSETAHTSIQAVQRFVDDLWKVAGEYTSPDLALEHTQYLLHSGDTVGAVATIQQYCTVPAPAGTKKIVPAKAWILWASLVPRERQRGVLERALNSMSMDRPDYMEVLLQHFGAQIADDVDEHDERGSSHLFDTLQKILLLAPKTTDDIVVATDTGLEFGLSSVFQAYRAYLDHASKKKTSGMQAARRIYTAILFQSTVRLTEGNLDDVKSFVDRCLQLEQLNASSGDGQKRLRRLYDKALEIFCGTSLEGSYRQERNEKSVYA
jgi:hypothetical protein